MMPILPRFRSKINVDSEDFKINYKEMSDLVKELKDRLKLATNQGEERHIKRHIESGQLLARDRIELLLDEDSPFLELMPLAGFGQKNMTVGGSLVAGIGLVCGIECLISASVPTIKGGAMNKISVKKSARLAEIAQQNRLISISLIQSAGADLTQQANVFHQGGSAFRDLAIKSKSGAPTICVVFGSSTAGAYMPGLSDYSIFVKNQAKVFLGGPPLVKMATGEIVDDETLGGAEMHSTVSGVSDFFAQNEHDAIRIAREIVHNLHYEKRTPLPKEHFGCIEEPFYSADELLGIVSPNLRKPFDVREVIARIVDGSRFSEFKALYGNTLVTCFAKIYGVTVGIIGNNGPLFSESANKGTQFIHLCNQRDTPIIFLQNVTGFMVGTKYEQGGIIKHGAQMINAVSNSGVPAITIIIGASYGAGNYAMCGRAYKPRFLFSWPNSRCSVMGEEQLAGVLDIIMRGAAQKSGKKIDEKAAEMRKRMFMNLVKEQSNVYYTSSRLIDDGIIDPRDTRTILGICLSVIFTEKVKGKNFGGVSRM